MSARASAGEGEEKKQSQQVGQVALQAGQTAVSLWESTRPYEVYATPEIQRHRKVGVLPPGTQFIILETRDLAPGKTALRVQVRSTPEAGSEPPSKRQENAERWLLETTQSSMGRGAKNAPRVLVNGSPPKPLPGQNKSVTPAGQSAPPTTLSSVTPPVPSVDFPMPGYRPPEPVAGEDGRSRSTRAPPVSARASRVDGEVIEDEMNSEDAVNERRELRNPREAKIPHGPVAYVKEAVRALARAARVNRPADSEQNPFLISTDSGPASTESGVSDCNCENDSQIPFEACPSPHRAYVLDRLPADWVDTASDKVGQSAEPSPQAQIPKACVFWAMKNYPDRGIRYGFCNDGESRPASQYEGQRLAKPCAAQDYVTVVYNSMVAVSNCLGVKPAELFGLVNQESGFHPNAISGTGCAGLGQLCGESGAIAAINKSHFKAYKKSVEESASASCKKIQQVGAMDTPMATSSQRRCERIAVEKKGQWIFDPTKNWIYTMIYYQQNRIEAEKRLAKIRGFQALEAQKKEELIVMAAQWMHNGGPGTLNIIEGLLLQKKDLMAQSREQILQATSAGIMANYPGGARRKKEVANYVPAIDQRNEPIKKQLGAKTCTSS